jgi:hypothetical protein
MIDTICKSPPAQEIDPALIERGVRAYHAAIYGDQPAALRLLAINCGEQLVREIAIVVAKQQGAPGRDILDNISAELVR